MISAQAVGRERLWFKPQTGTLPINGEEYPIIVISSERQDSSELIPDPIVSLGEGKFTFCTALAAYRGSWRGILPTNWDDSLNELPQDERKRQWLETLQKNRSNLPPTMSQELRDSVLEFFDACEAGTESLPVRRHLDATNLGSRENFFKSLELDRECPKECPITLWFQCPWNQDRPGGQMKFLKDIFTSASGVQKEGEFFLLGLWVGSRTPGDPRDQGQPLYFEMDGSLQAAARASGYECLGADHQLTGQMMQRGYEHVSDKGFPMGFTRPDQFATLLFRKGPL